MQHSCHRAAHGHHVLKPDMDPERLSYLAILLEQTAKERRPEQFGPVDCCAFLQNTTRAVREFTVHNTMSKAMDDHPSPGLGQRHVMHLPTPEHSTAPCIATLSLSVDTTKQKAKHSNRPKPA